LPFASKVSPSAVAWLKQEESMGLVFSEDAKIEYLIAALQSGVAAGNRHSGVSDTAALARNAAGLV